MTPRAQIEGVTPRAPRALMSDGETMINRVTITKLGIRLGQVTETFRRGQPNATSSR